MEWAIEKATELGVERIVPVLARRTEKHLALAAEKRVERWRRIAHEAAQQSRRSDVPAIEDATPLKLAARDFPQSARFVLAEQERGTTLRQAVMDLIEGAGDEIPSIRLAIGPEGGWAPEEAALLDAEEMEADQPGPSHPAERRQRRSLLSLFWPPCWSSQAQKKDRRGAPASF